MKYHAYFAYNWRYINVAEVSLITVKKLLQSAMELLQIATAFLLQSATRFITNCDRYYKVRWIYYKSRQVLQSAMIITNCDSTSRTHVKNTRQWKSTLKQVVEVASSSKYLISQVFTKCNSTSHLNNCENLSIRYIQQSESILP